MTDEKENVCGENVADADITSQEPDISGLYCLTGKPSDTSVPDVVQPESNPIISEVVPISPPIPPQVAPDPIIPENKSILPATPEIAVIPPKTKETLFVEALKIVVADKFDPLLVYAHAHLETAGFTKLIGNFNYAGMKPPAKLRPPNTPGWNGVIIKRPTHEWIKGKLVPVYDYFCDFSNAENFMIFYKFQVKRVYPPAYENRNSLQAYIYWIAKGGWGGNPDDYTDYEKAFTKRLADLRANGIYEKLNKLFV